MQQPNPGANAGAPNIGAPNIGAPSGNAPYAAAPNAGAPSAAAPSAEAQTGSLTSDTIKQAQQQLKSGGFYHGRVDGVVGPRTRVAVRRFQQRNGLKGTAMLDQETLQRLMSGHSPG
jgi:peptidoglycan hydrolase-like protein with peptidoglycan-binding domain